MTTFYAKDDYRLLFEEFIQDSGEDWSIEERMGLYLRQVLDFGVSPRQWPKNKDKPPLPGI